MLGHQKAAYQIIIAIFTTDMYSLDETRRCLLGWYIRFDLFNALLHGSDVKLAREWFIAYRDYFRRQAQTHPHDHIVRFQHLLATLRLLGCGLAHLKNLQSNEELRDGSVANRQKELGERFVEYGNELGAVFSDMGDATTIGSASGLLKGDGHLEQAKPGTVYSTDLFQMNFLLLDFWALDLVRRRHTEGADEAELSAHALTICKRIELLEQGEHAAPCVLLNSRNSLFIASFFIPKEPEYIDWVRRKFAAVEELG